MAVPSPSTVCKRASCYHIVLGSRGIRGSHCETGYSPVPYGRWLFCVACDVSMMLTWHSRIVQGPFGGERERDAAKYGSGRRQVARCHWVNRLARSRWMETQ